jgi:hypothetical protein
MLIPVWDFGGQGYIQLAVMFVLFFQVSQIHFRMIVVVKIAHHWQRAFLLFHLHLSIFLQSVLSQVLTSWNLSPSALQL